MVLESDGAAGPVLGADGDVLRESSSALDRGGVGTRRLVDVVGATIRLEGAQLGACRARVVVAVGLDDVVFDERAGGPAVEGQEGVAAGIDRAVVVDGTG